MSTVELLAWPRQRWWLRQPSRRNLWRLASSVFVLALIARLARAVFSRTLAGAASYDEWVHFGGAEMLLNGSVPYRDFTLLHPPGIILAQLPAALLGKISSEHVGVIVGRIGVMVLTSLMAAALAVAVRRWGTISALAAGLFAAALAVEVRVDTEIQLEPFYNTLLTVGVILAVTTIEHHNPRSAIMNVSALHHSTKSPLIPAPVRRWSRLLPYGAGVAFGLAGSIKLIAVVPAVAVIGFAGICVGWRVVIRMLITAAATGLLIVLPFFALAPRQFTEQVVFTQMGRKASALAYREQLGPISALPLVVRLGLIMLVALAVLAMIIWRVGLKPRSNTAAYAWAVFGVVAMTELLVLPSHWGDYDTIMTASLAIGFAALVAWLGGAITRRFRPLPVLFAACTLILCLQPMSMRPLLPHDFRPRPGVVQAAQIRTVFAVLPNADQCIASPLANYLIMGDRFADNLAQGCPVTLDPAGIASVLRSGFVPPELAHQDSVDSLPSLLQSQALSTGLTVIDQEWDYQQSKWLEAKQKTGDGTKVIAQQGLLTLWQVGQ
ncbi:MAG: hypothetical protein LBG70_01170 [Bifidobacteriaceae bacterium]|jgi:hypothetical protein|nr:hypothetical protein [Bifidobacteriaceae bacterium]